MAGRSWRLLFWIISAATGMLCAAGIASAANKLPLPDPVALVNGAPISRSDLRREVVRLERGGIGASVTRDRETELLREALNNLIDRELLYREALKQGFGVAPAALAAEVIRLKGGAEQAVEFERSLDELNLTAKEMQEQAERSMVARAFMEKRFAGQHEPSESDIASYYAGNKPLFAIPEQLRIRHILVKFDHSWQLEKKEEARQKVVRLRKRAAGGEDFAALALESSDCPSRTAGGDLGWIKKGQLAPFMERILFGLPVGGITEPVDDRFGYHIMQVTDRRPARTVTQEEARPRIQGFLRQEHAVRKAREYALTLRADVRIEVMAPLLKP